VPDLLSLAAQFSLQLFHFLQQAHELFPKISEPVFDSRGNFRKLNALEYSGSGELTQSV
jgi:hypothetical protein